MPLNVPGILVPFQLIVNPRIIVPGLIQDIRQIDFRALKKAGYRGAVFDKDNCLTVPYKDTLVPELESAWKECREVFGEGNVLIVSNSAGSRTDAGGIQAEAINHHLGVPVLFHSSLKPSYSCIASIQAYFRSLQHPVHDRELIIVGDRLFTDVVMANRMGMNQKGWIEHVRSLLGSSRPNSSIGDPTQSMTTPGTLAIWTTGVWKRESMVMRFAEKQLLEAVQKWSKPREGQEIAMDTSIFIREPPPPPPKSGLIQKLMTRLRFN
ncbi:hypothetical protein D9758_006342 [Tetrapyrgos nigripes]|uniref:Phosphatidylglycerophosphatase GEP4, mitochondrial n=1 Tax=Tetrapyrgos nigripes TaxID=182062 RepID=A0A8H5D8L4_9AGAR|nr:hypothetical protein D9758_006342 [Tetrapyrgos nigripes]